MAMYDACAWILGVDLPVSSFYAGLGWYTRVRSWCLLAGAGGWLVCSEKRSRCWENGVVKLRRKATVIKSCERAAWWGCSLRGDTAFTRTGHQTPPCLTSAFSPALAKYK